MRAPTGKSKKVSCENKKFECDLYLDFDKEVIAVLKSVIVTIKSVTEILKISSDIVIFGSGSLDI